MPNRPARVTQAEIEKVAKALPKAGVRIGRADVRPGVVVRYPEGSEGAMASLSLPYAPGAGDECDEVFG